MLPETQLTRETLASAPARYFEAIDAKDLDATMAQYADDAVETFLPANVTYSGREAISLMYEKYFATTNAVRHDLQNVVVDVDQLKVATEQANVNELKDGGRQERYNCNFFEFDPAGKVRRVIIWRSDGNPLS